MARFINDVKVTVEHASGIHTYTAPSGTLSGMLHGGIQHHQIHLTHSTHSKRLPDQGIRDEAGLTEDTERKKLIADHASVITDVLKAAETTKLNSAIKRERMEQEIAAQERADRITMMFAVNNAIQAGLSEEEVTAGMEHARSEYVKDMFDRVYDSTDLHTDAGMK